MSKQKCEWLVEPLDDYTNEVISREVSEEDMLRDVPCEDGIRRNMWLCTFSFAKYLWQSKGCGIDLKIFSRTINKGGSRGKAKDVTFLMRHKFLTKKKKPAKK
jgi:hypothetical protein